MIKHILKFATLDTYLEYRFDVLLDSLDVLLDSLDVFLDSQIELEL